MISIVLIISLFFVSFFLLAYTLIPILTKQVSTVSENQAKTFTTKMERMVMRTDAGAKHTTGLPIVGAIFGAFVAFILVPEELKLPGMSVFLVLGFLFPGMMLRIQEKKRKSKFNDQLIDALMIMSSSFRGGLSLIQAMEAVVEEMPDPIDREFGIVLSENKMGVALEETLNRLYKRMPSSAMQQTITAILLSRETGGNLPAIFSRIVSTIRENKKIQQNIDTLTIQGKIQGVVMSILPIAFLFVISSSKPDFLKTMLAEPIGRTMLTYAFFSEIIGAFFVWKISTFKDF